jgi:hypothetical protein
MRVRRVNAQRSLSSVVALLGGGAVYGFTRARSDRAGVRRYATLRAKCRREESKISLEIHDDRVYEPYEINGALVATTATCQTLCHA